MEKKEYKKLSVPMGNHKKSTIMPTVIYSPFITKFVSEILKAAAILSDTANSCLLHSLKLLSKKVSVHHNIHLQPWNLLHYTIQISDTTDFFSIELLTAFSKLFTSWIDSILTTTPSSSPYFIEPALCCQEYLNITKRDNGRHTLSRFVLCDTLPLIF